MQLVNFLLDHELATGTRQIERQAHGRQGNNVAEHLVRLLLSDEPLVATHVDEASVHRPLRGGIWMGVFTGPNGGQVWQSTGVTDRDQALLVARKWEAEARAQRAKSGLRPRKPIVRVRRSTHGDVSGLTQRQVAAVLGMSGKAVRQAEHRAFEKLRNHPLLRQLWRKHLAGELDEQQPILTLNACGSLLDYRMNKTCVDLATMKRTKTSLGKVVDAILQEGLYGKRGRLVITQPSKGQKTFPALVSHNTEPGQKPYRLSWWFPKGSPEDHGHVPLTKREADEILHGHLPERVWLYLVRRFDVQDVVFHPLQEGV